MRILIVDPEYLIAMDAERIIAAAFDCEIEIAMYRDYQASLEERDFDVVLIDPDLIHHHPEEIQKLRESGAGIVFTTSLTVEVAGVLNRPGIVLISKPFNDERLIEAIWNAAQNRRHSIA